MSCHLRLDDFNGGMRISILSYIYLQYNLNDFCNILSPLESNFVAPVLLDLRWTDAAFLIQVLSSYFTPSSSLGVLSHREYTLVLIPIGSMLLSRKKYASQVLIAGYTLGYDVSSTFVCVPLPSCVVNQRT